MSASASDFSFPGQEVSRIAFGSCHKSKYAGSINNIWKTIQQTYDPQVWLWSGDAVYPPARGIASIDLLRESYREMKENATVGYTSNMLAKTFGTWDDHDYGGNDAGHEMNQKMERAQLFWDFLGHNNPDPERSGVYNSVTFGVPPRQIKVINLDTRWNREEHCIPSVATMFPLGAGVACATRWLTAGLAPKVCRERKASILGEEQWKWFENELFRESEAPSVVLIVSSIQVLTTNPTMEGWGHFPSERDRLVRLLARKRNAQIFVLSGDVHHGEILDPQPSIEHRFLEVTSSGLTHDCSKNIYGKLCRPLLEIFSAHRYASKENYFVGKNFGTVSVDWENRSVEVQVRDASGSVVLTTGKRSLVHLPVKSEWTERHFETVHACMDGHLWPLVVAFGFAFVATMLFMPGRRLRNKSKNRRGRASR